MLRGGGGVIPGNEQCEASRGTCAAYSLQAVCIVCANICAGCFTRVFIFCNGSVAVFADLGDYEPTHLLQPIRMPLSGLLRQSRAQL